MITLQSKARMMVRDGVGNMEKLCMFISSSRNGRTGEMIDALASVGLGLVDPYC